MFKLSIIVFLIISWGALASTEDLKNFDHSPWESGKGVVLKVNKEFEIQDGADHSYHRRNPKTLEEKSVYAGTRMEIVSVNCSSYGGKPFTFLSTALQGVKCVGTFKLEDGKFINIVEDNIYGRGPLAMLGAHSQTRFIKEWLGSLFYTEEIAQSQSREVANTQRKAKGTTSSDTRGSRSIYDRFVNPQ